MADLISAFSKKSGRLSSEDPETLAFAGHCSANFQPTLDCFIPDFMLKYEDSEMTKADCINTVVSSLHQIKRLDFFWYSRYMKFSTIMKSK